VAFEVDAEVGADLLVVAAGHLVEHVAFRAEQGDAAVGSQQPGQGLRVASSTSHRGTGGTMRLAASAVRAIASARVSSCWLAAALLAAASAWAAACSAMRRRVAVSVIDGSAAAAWSRSNSATGRVRAVKTLLLRAPASMPTAMNRHSGSRQPGRGSTSTAPAATVASTARASMPAKSGGVCVAVATAATYSPSQLGRTSTGNAGTSPAIPNDMGGVQPCPPCAAVVSASSPARLASTAGSASEWARRMPRSITRRRRAASATSWA
jgi:hypothetical protein